MIPAYNEERFIGTLLEQIAAVDLAVARPREGNHRRRRLLARSDGGDRGRTSRASRCTGCRSNGGKGRAVRAGIGMATGEYLIIQDADLEYDPNDYVPMLRPLLAGEADVVYGSRYLTARQAPEPVVERVSRRAEPEPRRARLHRPVSHRHRDRAEAVPAGGAGRAAARNDRLRAGPRDHGAHARPRRADRRGADQLFPAEPRRGKEDRPARLVHRGVRTFWRYGTRRGRVRRQTDR